MPTASGLAAKKNPDRALCDDTRLISDLGAVNFGFDIDELFTVWVPSIIIDILEEIHRRRRRLPMMTATLRKRDIGGTFSRIFIRPDLSRLMMTEMDGRLLGLDDNVMVIYLLLPFGWVSSPSYFQLFGISILALRESYGMGDVGG